MADKDKDKISIYETITTTTDGKKSSTKSPRPSPGKAWKKEGNFYVKPAKPKLKNGKINTNVAWDDNKGWITAATQATAWDIPLAIINSDKGKNSLQSLFNEAWAAQKDDAEWTQEMFTTKLKDLPWYKSRSEAQRKFYTLSKDASQAAEFAKQIKSSKESVLDVAGEIGARLTDAQADEIARTNLQNGFNSAELKNVVAGYITYSGQTDDEKIGSLYGVAGDTEDAIRTWAKQNNVKVDNDWVLRQVTAISSGDYTVDKSKDYITNIAKQQYGAWADKLDGLTSVENLAAGYRQVVATELGEDSSKIDLTNEFVNNAMLAMDDKGKPITNQALLQTLRKSDTWAKVPKNKDKIYGLANDILSKFGMR
jgi:hypothetical protein